MLITKYKQITSNLFVENRLLKFCVLILTIAVCVNSYFTYMAINNERTVIVPSHIQETLEIENGDFSDRYLENMARNISNLALTYSPATARLQFDRLLGYFAPKVYPRAHSLWYSLATRVETAVVTSVFFMSKIKIDRGLNEIHVIGRRKQFSEDQLIGEDTKTYVISYQQRNGKFEILSLLEKVQHLKEKKAKKEEGEGS